LKQESLGSILLNFFISPFTSKSNSTFSSSYDSGFGQTRSYTFQSKNTEKVSKLALSLYKPST